MELISRNDVFDLYPQLGSVADPCWREIISASQVITLSAEKSVFRTGDSCRFFLLLLEGSIRVQKLTEDGHEITLYRVHPGEICELTTACLLAGKSYPAEAITETPVRALQVPKKYFENALVTAEAFREFVFSSIDRGMGSLINLVEDVAFGALDKRLAQRLLKMRNADEEVETTHQALAVELGTAREVVSRLLKEFERRNWVNLKRGRISILDPVSLGRLSRNGLN
jgi:CRP/FNR family transcriptional regulator